jgi:hypothetical protein
MTNDYCTRDGAFKNAVISLRASARLQGGFLYGPSGTFAQGHVGAGAMGATPLTRLLCPLTSPHQPQQQMVT